MRSSILLLFLTLISALAPEAARAAQSGGSEIDHMLLWGRDIDQATAVMTAKLGFQVRPGRDPDGLANRYVRMADLSYVEFFGITRPGAKLDPGAQADQDKLKGKPGSRGFALRASNLERTHAWFVERQFAPTAIFTASPNDPDGAGPGKPPRWRLFTFARQPLANALYYVDYASKNAAQGNDVDDRVSREHPNGARAVTALWLLSADADSERREFERLGYEGAKPVSLRQVSAKGFCVPVGEKRVFVLQPDGPGVAADALKNGGPQVFGASIGVADLSLAKRRVERGYEATLTSYRGTQGESFLAPTLEDLGVLLEFHAVEGGSNRAPCGGV